MLTLANRVVLDRQMLQVWQGFEFRNLKEAVDVRILDHDLFQIIELLEVAQIFRLDQAVKEEELEVDLFG